MIIRKFHVDAFTDHLFGGNPAAVCMLDHFLSDDILKAIAAEHNLSETAFVVAKDDYFEIRWFTPRIEVDLCGHATLAAAYVLFNQLHYKNDRIHFQTKTNEDLFVMKNDDLLTLDFPVEEPVISANVSELNFGIDEEILGVWEGRTKYIVLIESERQLSALRPNIEQLKTLDKYGVICTAQGDRADFVSRFFCPKIGINEDPVTGSAHTLLAPFWSERLNKNKMIAHQISARGGKLHISIKDDRVYIGGQAKLYSAGEIFLIS